MGVMEKLHEMGLKSGDVIDVLGYQLEYEEWEIHSFLYIKICNTNNITGDNYDMLLHIN